MAKDIAQEKSEQVLKNVIEKYNLDEKEKKELELATLYYDYEANDGLIITKRNDIVSMFRDEEKCMRLRPTLNQIKALTEYIKETEELYTFYGFDYETEEVIESILNESQEEKKMTKIELLNELQETIENNLIRYSADLNLTTAKEGYEKEWQREDEKYRLIEEIIKDEEKLEKKKNKERGR